MFSMSVKLNMDILSINRDITPPKIMHKRLLYFQRNKHSEGNTIADFQIYTLLLMTEFQIKHAVLLEKSLFHY